MIVRRFEKFKELKHLCQEYEKKDAFGYVTILAKKSKKLRKWLSKVEGRFPAAKIEGVVCKSFEFNYLLMGDEPVSLESILMEVLEGWNDIHVLKQYWRAVDHAMLVSKTDIDGVITDANETFSHISGYEKDELIGHPHNIIRHPDMPALLFKQMWETILAKKPWQGILKNRAKNGNAYWVDATIYPILNRKGQIEEFIALRKDITPRMDAIERLKMREKELQAILDHLDTVIFFVSKTEGVLSVNHRFFEIFGYRDLDAFKAEYDCLCDLFLDENAIACREDRGAWLSAISNNSQSRHKVKIKDKEGKVKTFLLKATPIDEKMERSVLTLTDITQLEEALIEAKMGEHSKSLFVANMSHEIRTPLNGIIGFTELLLRQANDPQTKNYLQIVHQSSRTLLGIVNDILDLSKLESGKMALAPTAVNLVEELQAITAIFAAKAKEQRIDYAVFIDPRMPKSLSCDIQRLKQVVANLVNNAVKFTPEEGRVRVDVEIVSSTDRTVRLYIGVQDSGIGIPAHKIEKIFDPFSQADDSISRRYGGTGLGLPISAKFVEMMGSKIEVDSKPGEGSNFYFHLDLDVLDPTPFLDCRRCIRPLSIRYTLPSPSQQALFETIDKYLRCWGLQWQPYRFDRPLPSDTQILFAFKSHDGMPALLRHDDPKAPLLVVSVETERDVFFEDATVRTHRLDRPVYAISLWTLLVEKSKRQEACAVHADRQDVQQMPRYRGRVLVAEDNEVNRMLIEVLLKDRGVEVDLVEDGVSAVEKACGEEPYDLILMDVNMPGMDGVQAAKEILRHGVQTPIVAMTANVMANERARYLQMGMRDHLSKPIETDALERILQKFLTPERAALSTHVRNDDDERMYAALQAETGIENREVLRNLFAKYLQSIDGYLESLQEAIEQDDRNKLADILHTIKGSSANMRFVEIAQACARLESMVRQEASNTALREGAETLVARLLAIKEEIARLLDR